MHNWNSIFVWHVLSASIKLCKFSYILLFVQKWNLVWMWSATIIWFHSYFLARKFECKVDTCATWQNVNHIESWPTSRCDVHRVSRFELQCYANLSTVCEQRGFPVHYRIYFIHILTFGYFLTGYKVYFHNFIIFKVIRNVFISVCGGCFAKCSFDIQNSRPNWDLCRIF